MRFKISNIPRQKWLLVFKVVIFNIAIVPIILFTTYQFAGLGSTNFRSEFPTYFYPLNQFWYFFIKTAWPTALMEETFFRGPIWILSASGFTLSVKERKLDNLLIWIAILVPTAFWAYGHTMFNLPVFIAGTSWGWLVSKTRSLWPAIVSHMMANIVIYFALKILLLFVII